MSIVGARATCRDGRPSRMTPRSRRLNRSTQADNASLTPCSACPVNSITRVSGLAVLLAMSSPV